MHHLHGDSEIKSTKDEDIFTKKLGSPLSKFEGCEVFVERRDSQTCLRHIDPQNTSCVSYDNDGHERNNEAKLMSGTIHVVYYDAEYTFRGDCRIFCEKGTHHVLMTMMDMRAREERN